MASGSSEDLRHKGMCSCAAWRKQRIREINWGSCKKTLFIWPDLNILVREGFYSEKMVYQAWPGLGIPAAFIWLWTGLDHLALGDKGCKD